MFDYDTGSRCLKFRPRLKVSETFYSVQGEGRHIGLPCSFIRLTGCALRCHYCDTEYAFHGGRWTSFEQLESWLRVQPSKLVQITGGEPLHQGAVWPFVDRLIDAGFRPLIETSGAVDIQGLNPLTHICMDIKTPASGEDSRNRWSNLDQLKASDEVKFVVCSADDLSWSIDCIRQRRLDQRFHVLISPEARIADKSTLADQVLSAGIQVRFQVQLHKVLWGEEPGR